MVWALIPVDSLRGAQKYYIFSKGTYHVGRKGCDIIIQTDTSISRNHAEIVVDQMISLDSSCPVRGKLSSCVRVIDKSKYGTFVSKETRSKADRLVKNKDATLSDGDLITFGTSNATFRFCYIPINVFIHTSNDTKLDSSLQATLSAIGARSSCTWNHECTHVLVDKCSSITLELIEAVIVKKPVVVVDWIKVLAEKGIRTEIPSCMSHTPTLTLEGTSIRIVDPTARDKCLEGFTFVLGSLPKYKFGEKLQPLLEAVGAKFIRVEDFCSGSQTSADGENSHVLVVPQESQTELKDSRELFSLSRITDLKLAASILSGHLDSSILEQPSIMVSSSHSTDETIVADSDVEMDTATSNIVATTAKSQDAIKCENEDQAAKMMENNEHTTKHQEIEESTDYHDRPYDAVKTSYPKDEDFASIKKLHKGDESFADGHEKSDIIFSQDLIARDIAIQVPVQSGRKNVVNFKRFRKGKTTSGNSFSNLIPFSKDPYKESDYGSNETEYMREEKKRKQLEALAEDLFNNEKVRKRAAGGASLQSFLGRR